MRNVQVLQRRRTAHDLGQHRADLRREPVVVGQVEVTEHNLQILPPGGLECITKCLDPGVGQPGVEEVQSLEPGEVLVAE